MYLSTTGPVRRTWASARPLFNSVQSSAGPITSVSRGEPLHDRGKSAVRIRDILQTKGTDVIVIGPDASVRELVALLKEHNLGTVIVSTDGTTMDGIVSERDVVRRMVTDAEVLNTSVAEVMTQVVHTCHPQDSVESLMSTMTDHRIRHLPVLDDDDRLCGIVSIGDVVKSTIVQLQFERDRLQEYVTT